MRGEDGNEVCGSRVRRIKRNARGRGVGGKAKGTKMGTGHQDGDIPGTECMAGDWKSLSPTEGVVPLAPQGDNVSVSNTRGSFLPGVWLQPCPGSQRLASQ